MRNHLQNLFHDHSDQFETEMPALSHPRSSISQDGEKVLNFPIHLVVCANCLRNFIS